MSSIVNDGSDLFITSVFFIFKAMLLLFLLPLCVWGYRVGFMYCGKVLNPYKPSVLFVGQGQTEQNQIRRRKTRRLIRLSTVCLQKSISKFGSNEN